MSDAYVTLVSPIDEPSVGRFAARLTELAESHDTIHILLQSFGGSAVNAFALHSLLRALPCRIVAWNLGEVSSAGILLLLAAEQRYAVPGAVFGFHGCVVDLRAWADALPAHAGCLTAGDLESKIMLLRADNERLAAVYRERCPGLSAQEIGSLLGSDPVYHTAAWAKARGLIHATAFPYIPKGARHEVVGPPVNQESPSYA